MNKKPEITFKYVFNYNYNPSYVNGAQGGVSPRGEIVVHFYHERPALPDSVTHELTSQGGIGRETAVEPESLPSTMVRFIDTGITMNYENARVFHAWLGDRLKEMEALQKTQQAFEAAKGGAQA
ncbi:MAG: hypothetical protein FD174_1082 [Geobacteraceae bacterium]|nr:MAG: hypothetical protein FD174_1082 [Geobacteraceae bacterium]